MPRTRLLDVLQSHLFWAFDASGSGVPVFNPLFGFSRITSPEISAEIETFKDGTFLYNRSIVKGGTVSPIIFERAASMFDCDFYDWIMFTLHGNKDFEDGGTLGKISNALSGVLGGAPASPRRNLLIVQFTNINLAATGDGLAAQALRIAGTAAASAVAAAAFGAGGGIALAAAVAGGAGSVIGLGPFAFAMRIPARAWLLHNCLPTRYKSGSDFDAASAQVSLQELEVMPEHIEEFSLGIKP